MITHVYLVVPEGVTTHSPAAVCATRHQATAIAEKLWKQSDGYHTFRIEARRLGKVYETFPLVLFSHRKPTSKPPQIEQVTEAKVAEGY